MADQRRKVLIADSISEEGINVLRSEARVDLKVGLKPAEIAAIIGDDEFVHVHLAFGKPLASKGGGQSPS